MKGRLLPTTDSVFISGSCLSLFLFPFPLPLPFPLLSSSFPLPSSLLPSLLFYFFPSLLIYLPLPPSLSSLSISLHLHFSPSLSLSLLPPLPPTPSDFRLQFVKTFNSSIAPSEVTRRASDPRQVKGQVTEATVCEGAKADPDNGQTKAGCRYIVS